MKAMEGKVAELAMDAASRIMGKKNDEAQDMSLYDQFLEGAGDPLWADRLNPFPGTPRTALPLP